MDYQFVPGDWCKNHSRVAVDSTYAAPVYGPTDVLRIQECREKLTAAGVEFGRKSLADVFVWAVGEPPNRATTKIGGLPFFPKHRLWPHGQDQSPLPFIAQFDFRGSLDIVEEAIGRKGLLLIFGRLPAKEADAEVKLEWVDADTSDDELIDRSEVPVDSPIGPFHGCRWRTANYPDAILNPRNAFLFDEDITPVQEPWLAFRLYGTQIGRHPFMVSRTVDSPDPDILCSLAPVVPLLISRDSTGSYPFLNVRSPIQAGKQSIRHCGKEVFFVNGWLDYMEGSLLLICRGPDGKLFHKYQG